MSGIAAPSGATRLPAAGRRSRISAISARLQALADHEDKEFLPAALAIRDRPASPYALGFVWTVAAGFALALAWSCFARLDIFAVAPGRVQISGRSKVVQPYDTGKVQAVRVENGSQVKAGDVLVELEPTEAEADYRSKALLLESLEAEIPRRMAEVKAFRANARAAVPDFPDAVSELVRERELSALSAELSQYLAARETIVASIAEKDATEERLAGSIAARRRLLTLHKERAEMRETLASKAAGSRASVIDAVQVVEQTMGDLAAETGQLAETKAARRSLERKAEQLTEDAVAQQVQRVTELSQKRDGIRQEVIKASLRLDRTRLTAPIDGTVQQLAVTTLGQVVGSGSSVLVVVPQDGTMEIEALIQNRDVGFVTPGQEATIKVDAFPFTRYGTLPGRVVRVSRDAIDDREAGGSADTLSAARGSSPVSGTPRTQNLVYPVTIELGASTITGDAGPVRLTPGMTATVEIRTGSRRVIDFLLSPILETTSQAGHER